MDRRSFLMGSGLAVPSILSSVHSAIAAQEKNKTQEMKADLVVIGAGLGGCAAALAALRHGLHVIMTEETDWIGGQMTQQGVPPDEHPWIESFGATQTYRRFRNGIRDYYRRNYPLTAEARQVEFLNPGNGGVSRLCHEPRVSLAVLYEMLAPYISGKRLTIMLDHKAVAAETNGDSVTSVTVTSAITGNSYTLHAPYFIDATELGDLLPLTKTEYFAGFESQKETNEMHAPTEAQPANMQSITWCFAMDYIDGENHVIEKPKDYDFWRNYTPNLTPAWPGKQLNWAYTHPVTLKPVTDRTCDPLRESEDMDHGFWHYRRIAYKKYHQAGAYASDITLVNWPHNDYMLGNIFDVPEEEREKHLRQAKQLSLSLFYWMQTEAPRSDGGAGWPGLRLRGDILGTEDGLAKYPYIRESRRIKAEFTVCEQHVGTDARMKLTGKSREEVTAEAFVDSVGVGSYRIDLHPSTGGDNYIDISSLPFQIPLGALIPQRMENLLPACKNLGVTHITNGCYRLHPVEWNIGESAGILVAYCLQKKEKPRGVRNMDSKLRDFQNMLRSQGIEIAWPRVTPR
ncbi:MAG: FAD-dependent oxidoreductase [Candidatus Omnitrophota bacterium]|nr:MAG: FAD-dependent oxidoreductase [Candidatus Omnitrophota bacterium]